MNTNKLPNEPVDTTPSITPKISQLLEFAHSSETKVTPKDINQALNSIVHDYDKLTEEYRNNKLHIASELVALKQNSSAVSSHLRQINAKIETQKASITEVESVTNKRISQSAKKNTTDIKVVAISLQQKLANESVKTSTKFNDLNTDISQIKQLSVRQENILTELHDQLDEFNLVQKLLSKHTRANRQRIETVQVDTQKQHNLQELKIEGLNALQNNQQEELNSIQALIAELQQEANHINGSINILSRDLEHHANATQVKFKHTAAAIGAVLLLTIAGFSSVKWLPAFAPQGMVEIENNMDRLILDVDSISQVKIQTQEISEHASALENKTSNLQSQVGQIESDFTDLKYEILGPGILSNKTLTPVLPLNDQAWLMQQDSSAYTIQMVGVYSYDDMAIFINDNTSALQDSQLSYTKTNRGQREWFNLFSGVYPTFESALNAIASMPLRLRVNKPWIRNIEEVQNSVN